MEFDECESNPSPVKACNFNLSMSNSINLSKTKLKIEDFEMIGTLGQGSYGKVYCALEKNSKKKFAVKVLDKYHIMKVTHTSSHSFLPNISDLTPFLLPLELKSG